MTVQLCPRCKKNYYTPYGDDYKEGSPPFAALSRRDNRTYICSECGTWEAFEDMNWAPPWKGEKYWQDVDGFDAP